VTGSSDVTDPAVRALISAINEGDRAVLTVTGGKVSRFETGQA